MKHTFKSTWNSSVQPRKQRKYKANAPKHIKGKFLSAPLAKDLQKEHNTRSLRVRVGDEVEVLRGSFKGDDGKVERVDTKNSKLYIHGVERVSPTGSKTLVPIPASNVRITQLEEDAKRVNKK
jgi:large subunit ribosomal protein L24